MVPPAPPLPVPRNLPFQLPEGGIHTSILTCDSGEGLIVAATRQDAGTVRDGAPAGAPTALNGPASAAVADVMVVSGNVKADSRSHGPAAAFARKPTNGHATAVANRTTGTNSTGVRRRRIMWLTSIAAILLERATICKPEYARSRHRRQLTDAAREIASRLVQHHPSGRPRRARHPARAPQSAAAGSERDRRGHSRMRPAARRAGS